jgi:hypothetical protein
LKITRSDGCRRHVKSRVLVEAADETFAIPDICAWSASLGGGPGGWTGPLDTQLPNTFWSSNDHWIFDYDPFSLIDPLVDFEDAYTSGNPSPPRNNTWNVSLSILAGGKAIYSATLVAGWQISGTFVPAKTIWESDQDNFINICINGGYTLRSKNGELYCTVPADFSQLSASFTLTG